MPTVPQTEPTEPTGRRSKIVDYTTVTLYNDAIDGMLESQKVVSGWDDKPYEIIAELASRKAPQKLLDSYTRNAYTKGNSGIVSAWAKIRLDIDSEERAYNSGRSKDDQWYVFYKGNFNITKDAIQKGKKKGTIKNLSKIKKAEKELLKAERANKRLSLLMYGDGKRIIGVKEKIIRESDLIAFYFYKMKNTAKTNLQYYNHKRGYEAAKKRLRKLKRYEAKLDLEIKSFTRETEPDKPSGKRVLQNNIESLKADALIDYYKYAEKVQLNVEVIFGNFAASREKERDRKARYRAAKKKNDASKPAPKKK